jgi:hypothetical protein
MPVLRPPPYGKRVGRLVGRVLLAEAAAPELLVERDAQVGATFEQRIPVECRRKYRKWLEGESRPAADQDNWLARGECAAPPKHAFVSVAITGGGNKSAIYATEVLFELRRYGLLREVDVVSSVSGGSFAALVYGLSFELDTDADAATGSVSSRWASGSASSTRPSARRPRLSVTYQIVAGPDTGRVPYPDAAAAKSGALRLEPRDSLSDPIEESDRSLESGSSSGESAANPTSRSHTGGSVRDVQQKPLRRMVMVCG